MEDVVLVGSGGFAREVKFLIEDINMVNKRFNIIGLVSNENFGDDEDEIITINDETENNYFILKNDDEKNVSEKEKNDRNNFFQKNIRIKIIIKK